MYVPHMPVNADLRVDDADLPVDADPPVDATNGKEDPPSAH